MQTKFEPTELWQFSATGLARGLRDGQFSATEILESVLSRVDEVNPKLNAVVEDLRQSATDTARLLDAAAAQNRWQGPLHGIPATIKINVDQAGESTNNGLPVLADHVAEADAPVTRLMRDAGAVLFGRNNAPELSMRATTVNPLYGRTTNPWSDDASPGGSSGGAGSAAAAGMGPIHHGNDIGGSLRFPASACGVTSLKPTNGRVPAFNPSATAERGMLAQLMSVQGVICRTVADVQLGLQTLIAEDPADPWWVPVAFEPERTAQAMQDDKPVVGYTLESYGYPLDEEIRQGILAAVGALRDAGFEVEEVTTPSMSDAAAGWMKYATYELQRTLGPTVEQACSEDLRNIFDWFYQIGPMSDMDGYVAGIAERTAQTRQWNQLLAQYPLLVTPFLMRPGYSWDYDASGYDSTYDLMQSAQYSTGVNYLSLPAGVLPSGLAQGLPTAVQIIGKRYREDLILYAMQAIEERLGVLYPHLWEK